MIHFTSSFEWVLFIAGLLFSILPHCEVFLLFCPSTLHYCTRNIKDRLVDVITLRVNMCVVVRVYTFVFHVFACKPVFCAFIHVYVHIVTYAVCVHLCVCIWIPGLTHDSQSFVMHSYKHLYAEPHLPPIRGLSSLISHGTLLCIVDLPYNFCFNFKRIMITLPETLYWNDNYNHWS